MAIQQERIEKFIAKQREKGIGLSIHSGGDLYRTPVVKHPTDGKFYHFSYRIADGKVLEPKLMVQASPTSKTKVVTENDDALAQTLLIRRYESMLNLSGTSKTSAAKITQHKGAAKDLIKGINDVFKFFGAEESVISETATANRGSTFKMLKAFERMAGHVDPLNQRGLIEKPKNRLNFFRMVKEELPFEFVVPVVKLNSTVPIPTVDAVNLLPEEISVPKFQRYNKLPIVEVAGQKLRTRLTPEGKGGAFFSIAPENGGKEIDLFDYAGQVRKDFTDPSLASKFGTPQKFLQAYTKAFLEMSQQVLTQNTPPEITPTPKAPKVETSTTPTAKKPAVATTTTTAREESKPAEIRMTHAAMAQALRALEQTKKDQRKGLEEDSEIYPPAILGDRRKLDEKRALLSISGDDAKVTQALQERLESATKNEAGFEIPALDEGVPSAQEIKALQTYKFAFGSHLKLLSRLETAVSKALTQTELLLRDDGADEKISAMVEEIAANEIALEAQRKQYLEDYSPKSGSLLTRFALLEREMTQSAAAVKKYQEDLFDSIGKPSTPGNPGVLSEFLRSRPNVFEQYATDENPAMLDVAHGLKNFLSDTPDDDEKKKAVLSKLAAVEAASKARLAKAEAIEKEKSDDIEAIKQRKLKRIEGISAVTAGKLIATETTMSMESFTGSSLTATEETDSIEKAETDFAKEMAEIEAASAAQLESDLEGLSKQEKEAKESFAAAMEKCLSPRLKRDKAAAATVASMLCELTPKFYTPTGLRGDKKYPDSSLISVIDMLSQERKKQPFLTKALEGAEEARYQAETASLNQISGTAGRFEASPKRSAKELREEHFKSLRERAAKGFTTLTASAFTKYGQPILSGTTRRDLELRTVFFTKVLEGLTLSEKPQKLLLVQEYADRLQDLASDASNHHAAIVEGRTTTPLHEMPQEELNIARKALESLRDDKLFGPIIANLETYEKKLGEHYERLHKFDLISETASEGLQGFKEREEALIGNIVGSIKNSESPSGFSRFYLGAGKFFANLGRGIGAVDSRLGIPFISSGCASVARSCFEEVEYLGRNNQANQEMVKDALTSSFANERYNALRINRSPFERIRNYLTPKPPVVERNRESLITAEAAQKVIKAESDERSEVRQANLRTEEALIEAQFQEIGSEISSSKDAILERITDMLQTTQDAGIELDKIAPLSRNANSRDYRTLLKSTNPKFFLRIKEEEGQATEVQLFEKGLFGSKKIENLFDGENLAPGISDTFEDLLRQYESDINAKAESADRKAAQKAEVEAAVAGIKNESASMVGTFVEETPNLEAVHEAISPSSVTLKTRTRGKDSYSLTYNAANPTDFKFLKNGHEVEFKDPADLEALRGYFAATRQEIIRLETIEEVKASDFALPIPETVKGTRVELELRTAKLIHDADRFGVKVLKASENTGLKGYENLAKDDAESHYFIRIHRNGKNIDDIKLFKKGKTLFGSTIIQSTEIPAIDASGNLTPEFEQAFAAADKLLAPSRKITKQESSEAIARREARREEVSPALEAAAVAPEGHAMQAASARFSAEAESQLAESQSRLAASPISTFEHEAEAATGIGWTPEEQLTTPNAEPTTLNKASLIRALQGQMQDLRKIKGAEVTAITAGSGGLRIKLPPLTLEQPKGSTITHYPSYFVIVADRENNILDVKLHGGNPTASSTLFTGDTERVLFEGDEIREGQAKKVSQMIEAYSAKAQEAKSSPQVSAVATRTETRSRVSRFTDDAQPEAKPATIKSPFEEDEEREDDEISAPSIASAAASFATAQPATQQEQHVSFVEPAGTEATETSSRPRLDSDADDLVMPDLTGEKQRRSSNSSAASDDTLATLDSIESQGIDEVIEDDKVIKDKESLLAGLQAQIVTLKKMRGAEVKSAGKSGGEKIKLPSLSGLAPSKGSGPVHPSYFVIVTDKAGKVTDVELHGGDLKSSLLVGPDHKRELFEGDKIKPTHVDNVAAMMEQYSKMSEKRGNPSTSPKATRIAHLGGQEADVTILKGTARERRAAETSGGGITAGNGGRS